MNIIFMKNVIPPLLALTLLNGCSSEMPDLAGDYLINHLCQGEQFSDQALAIDSEYLPNVGYKYTITFPEQSPLLPDGHPRRSYRSSTHERHIIGKFYRPSSHIGVDGFETDLQLTHLPNDDLIIEQWNVKSWHHATRAVSAYTLGEMTQLAPYRGEATNQQGEQVAALCLRKRANI